MNVNGKQRTSRSFYDFFNNCLSFEKFLFLLSSPSNCVELIHVKNIGLMNEWMDGCEEQQKRNDLKPRAREIHLQHLSPFPVVSSCLAVLLFSASSFCSFSVFLVSCTIIFPRSLSMTVNKRQWQEALDSWHIFVIKIFFAEHSETFILWTMHNKIYFCDSNMQLRGSFCGSVTKSDTLLGGAAFYAQVNMRNFLKKSWDQS